MDISNEQLGRMLDEFEIKKVAHRFARGLDRADKDMIQSCFHPDGTDDHGIFQGSASDFCDWVMNALENCLLYTSPSPRDQRGSRMPSSA